MFGLLYCYIQEDNFGIGSKSCNELRALNFDVEKMIESEFNKEEDYKPISFDNLRDRNPELYQQISVKLD